MSLSSPWSLPILVTVVGLAIVASDVTSDATVIETPAANHASQAPARDSHEPSTGTAAGVSVVPAPGPTSNPYTPSVTVPVGTGFIERRSAVPVQAPTQQAPAQYAPVQGYTPVNQYPPAARSYPSGLYPPVPQSAWPQQSSSVHRTPAPPSVQPQPVCEPQYKFSATASIPHPTRIPAASAIAAAAAPAPAATCTIPTPPSYAQIPQQAAIPQQATIPLPYVQPAETVTIPLPAPAPTHPEPSTTVPAPAESAPSADLAPLTTQPPAFAEGLPARQQRQTQQPQATINVYAQAPMTSVAQQPREQARSRYFPVQNFDRSKMKYAGKSFEEWQAEFLQELKPDSRAETIKALIVFGRNGYGPEATGTLLQAIEAYPTAQLLGEPDHTQETIYSESEDAETLTHLYSGVIYIGKPGEPALLEAARHGEHCGRSLAIMLLASSDAPEAQQILKAALSTGSRLDRRVALMSFELFSSEHVDSYETQLVALLSDKEHRRDAWNALMLGEPDPSELWQPLVEIYQDSDEYFRRDLLLRIADWDSPDARTLAQLARLCVKNNECVDLPVTACPCPGNGYHCNLYQAMPVNAISPAGNVAVPAGTPTGYPTPPQQFPSNAVGPPCASAPNYGSAVSYEAALAHNAAPSYGAVDVVIQAQEVTAAMLLQGWLSRQHEAFAAALTSSTLDSESKRILLSVLDPDRCTVQMRDSLRLASKHSSATDVHPQIAELLRVR